MNKLLDSGFIDFLPLSYLHEPPKEIPITYSDVLFSDVLPPEVLAFFQANAKVVPIKKGEGNWYIDPKADLIPCRAIDVSFEAETQRSFPYMLFGIENASFDEKTGYFEFRQTMPNNPPSVQEFNNWVTQSINQAARRYFNEIFKEVSLSDAYGAAFLTQSSFVHQLLGKTLPLSANLKTDVLNLSLDLSLPILENVTLNHILDIRKKDGESFENFRIELEQQLRELRTINDPDELSIRLENVTHEIVDVQIREVEKNIARIKRKMFPDALILVGGLAAVIQAQGLGIPALVYAIQNGVKTYQEYIAGVREKPAYFLWKLKKAG